MSVLLPYLDYRALGDTSNLTAAGLVPADGQQRALVVAYCDTGERSSAVAAALGTALGVSEVRSLCGGILSYYNEGGNVRAPGRGGAIVQAVHPGSGTLKGLVTRGNVFKMASSE